MPRCPVCTDPMPDTAQSLEHDRETEDLQQLVSDYAAIGSPEEWARRCAEPHGHDRTWWEAVANLVTLGTRKLEDTSLELAGFRRLCPRATPATFWIFWHTEYHTNDKLYIELLKCLPCGPDTSRFGDWEEFAKMSVVHVEKALAKDVAYWMKGSGKGKGATTGNSSLVYRNERS